MDRTLLSPGYKQKIALEILDEAAKKGCALCADWAISQPADKPDCQLRI